MPVPSMPSLPPQDGVDAQICAGIRAGAPTVSAINRLTHVVGTSLPLPPTGEYDAIGSPSGIFLSPPCALCKHGGGSPHTRPHDRSYGSMAPLPATTEATPLSLSLAHPSPPAWSYPSHPHQTMGGILERLMAPSPATTEVATPLPSSAHPFLPTRSSPTHPLPSMGGSAALAAGRALPCSLQRLAFAMSTDPGFADKNPWVMEAINAVARELQCWYRRHSIRRYLARQTRQRLATTTLQCWKWHIWLDRWFAQQDIQCQKCLHLQSLCCGALAYAMSVRGDRRPPPTPANKPSDPKVLHHPFWDRGLPLPQRRQARQNNRPRPHPG
jgi:hypothetical protein